MIIPSDENIDRLLEALDRMARLNPYPPQGLPIHGPTSMRAPLRLEVAMWLAANDPESQR